MIIFLGFVVVLLNIIISHLLSKIHKRHVERFVGYSSLGLPERSRQVSWLVPNAEACAVACAARRNIGAYSSKSSTNIGYLPL